MTEMEFIIGAIFGLLVYIALWCYGVEKAILRALEMIENKMGDVYNVHQEIKTISESINESINEQTEVLKKIEENIRDTVKLSKNMTDLLDAIQRK